MERNWIHVMAEQMLLEITEEMAGIHLTTVETKEREVRMDGVCGRTDGDHRMRFQFRAEPGVFYRMAKNMIGDEPTDTEEVQEYAVEFFNVLCGRFISEIHQATKSSARFAPTHYEEGPKLTFLDGEEQLVRLQFISDENELVEFVWTNISVEKQQGGKENG